MLRLRPASSVWVRRTPAARRGRALVLRGASPNRVWKRLMNAQTILGIDPRKSGAIAVLDEAAISSKCSTCRRHGKLTGGPRPTRHCSRGSSPVPMPTSPFASSSARARRSPSAAPVASFEGCAGALGLPIVFLTPLTWRRLADIPPGAENKDLARTRAIARWPPRADLFARKCDVDRPGACLIALAGLRRETHHV
jgi:hypothetical protein